jgi:hypothetical protein
LTNTQRGRHRSTDRATPQKDQEPKYRHFKPLNADTLTDTAPIPQTPVKTQNFGIVDNFGIASTVAKPERAQKGKKKSPESMPEAIFILSVFDLI